MADKVITPEIEVRVIQTNEEDEEPDKWEIDCWVRSVIEAEEIKKDPKKMKYVSVALKEKQDALNGAVKSLRQLKNKANAMEEPE